MHVAASCGNPPDSRQDCWLSTCHEWWPNCSSVWWRTSSTATSVCVGALCCCNTNTSSAMLAATRVSATCLGRTACWFYLRFNEHKCSTAEFNRTIETLTTCWKWRACAEDVRRPTDVALLGCHHYKYQIITDRVNGQDIVIGRVRLSVCFHSLFWTNRPLISIFACVLLMTIARRAWTVEATVNVKS